MADRPPYVQRIYEYYRRKIETGALKPGDALPTIADLTHDWGCSERPVKLALVRLKREGYTEGHKGVGTYVAANPPRR